MATQDISEIIVRVVAETQSAEAALRRFGTTRDQALTGGAAAQAAKSNAQAAIDAEAQATTSIIAERIKRNSAVRSENAATRREAAILTNDLADLFRIGPALSDSITGVDTLRFKLRETAQEVVIARNALNQLRTAGASIDEVTAAEGRLNTALRAQAAASAPLRGLGGLARGVAGAFISTAIQAAIATPVFAAAGAAVQGIFDVGSRVVDNLINPTKAAAAAFDDLGKSISAAGGPEKFGQLTGLSSSLQAFADAVASATQNQPGFAGANSAIQAALASGGQAPAQVVRQQRRQEFIQSALVGAGRGDVISSIATGFDSQAIDKNIAAIRQLSAEAQIAFAKAREATAQSINRATGYSGIDAARNSARAIEAGIKAAAGVEFDKLNPVTEAAAAATTLASKTEQAAAAIKEQQAAAGGLVSALRAGSSLSSDQITLLRQATGEKSAQALIDSQAQRAMASQNAIARQMKQTRQEIALLEGRSSGNANKDALTRIDAQRKRLDEREKTIEEAAFRRERAAAERNMAATIARAGIAQAGQTSFDVAAAEREALAQAADQKAQFADEDQRRQIQAQRDQLDRETEFYQKRQQLQDLYATLSQQGGEYQLAKAETAITKFVQATSDAIAAAAAATEAAVKKITGLPIMQPGDTYTERAAMIRANAVITPADYQKAAYEGVKKALDEKTFEIDGQEIGRVIAKDAAGRATRVLR